jgi:hypothetical protein
MLNKGILVEEMVHSLKHPEQAKLLLGEKNQFNEPSKRS